MTNPERVETPEDRHNAYINAVNEVYRGFDERRGRHFGHQPAKTPITPAAIIVAMVVAIILGPPLLVAMWYVAILWGRYADFLARLVGLLP